MQPTAVETTNSTPPRIDDEGSRLAIETAIAVAQVGGQAMAVALSPAAIVAPRRFSYVALVYDAETGAWSMHGQGGSLSTRILLLNALETVARQDAELVVPPAFERGA